MNTPTARLPDAVGSEIPSLTLPPINRTTLALFAGASHDHTPIHLDIDFVREAGGSDVIAHGMYVMANMARLLTRWRPQRDLVALTGRFLDVVHVGDVLTYAGRISDRQHSASGWLAEVEITVTTLSGRKVMSGVATVRADPLPPSGATSDV